MIFILTINLQSQQKLINLILVSNIFDFFNHYERIVTTLNKIISCDIKTDK